MMYYLVADGHIVDGVEIETGKQYDTWKRGLKDGQELVTSFGLTSRQIYEYLDDVNAWDDRLVPGLMEEMCERLELDFDEFECYCDLFDAITEKMGLTS